MGLENQIAALRAQLAEVTDKLAAAGRETVEALNRLMVAERERDRYLTEGKWEYVALGGFEVLTVGPPSRKRKIMAIVEHVFMTERDAIDACKACGGTWVKRKRHATRKVEMREARKEQSR